MSEEINHERRGFIGAVATAIAAAQFGMTDYTAATQSSNSFVYLTLGWRC